MAKPTTRTYPWTTKTNDLEVTFRKMTAADRDRVLAFTQSLPERNLLFMRIDITKPDVVDQWVKNIEDGVTVTILAEESGELVGYCSLHHNVILWARHLGEIRLLVAPNFRGKGLGGLLARQIFDIAQKHQNPAAEEKSKLLKLVVNMMSTQRDAQSLFHRLGFIPEAMLHDWAIDRAGRTHDLIIMSREVEDN